MRPAVIIEWKNFKEDEQGFSVSPNYLPAYIDADGNIHRIDFKHHYNDTGHSSGFISEYYAMKEAIAYCDGIKDLEEKISSMDLDVPLK